jgi:hypothetical protein
VGQTNYQALVETAKIKEGQKVLILGGSGGTGLLFFFFFTIITATHCTWLLACLQGPTPFNWRSTTSAM